MFSPNFNRMSTEDIFDYMKEHTNYPWDQEEDVLPYLNEYDMSGDPKRLIRMFAERIEPELEMLDCPTNLIDGFAEQLAWYHLEYLCDGYAPYNPPIIHF